MRGIILGAATRDVASFKVCWQLLWHQYLRKWRSTLHGVARVEPKALPRTQLIFLCLLQAGAPLTIKSSAATPPSNTPLSNPTEIVCNRANSASKGFPAAVASIDPICTRSTAILGLTATCEITVKMIINITHNAAGATKEVKLRIRKSRTNKITTPQTIPIQCIRVSEYP